MKCPCKTCDKRTLTCRQVCEPWKAWQEEHRLAKERERREADATQYRIGVCVKIRGRKKR